MTGDQLMLLAECPVAACTNPVVGTDPCDDCQRVFGPHLNQAGTPSAWVPSGWVRPTSNGGWGIPWGIAEHPDVIADRSRTRRHAAAAAIEHTRNVRLAGLDQTRSTP